VRHTKKAKKDWLRWLETYGAEKFLDLFLRNVEGAIGTCRYCHQPISVDVLIGGGVPDWSTDGGDFGCEASPETDDEGMGGHMPVKYND